MMRIKKLFYSLLFLVTFNNFSQEVNKGKLIYTNSLSNAELVKDWVLEGPAKIEFKDSWLQMYSPNEEGHHVLLPSGKLKIKRLTPAYVSFFSVPKV